MQKNKTSPHILNTSSNLLGICFIVLTALKVQKLNDATLIDEFTLVDISFFMASSILSFLSMNMDSEKLGEKAESLANLCFFMGLLVMFATIVLATLNLIP